MKGIWAGLCPECLPRKQISKLFVLIQHVPGNHFGYQEIYQLTNRYSRFLINVAAKFECSRYQSFVNFGMFLKVFVSVLFKNRFFVGKVLHDISQERIECLFKRYWFFDSCSHLT